MKVSCAELKRVLNGESNEIRPSDGLKEFLLALKARGVKIGLASSGLFYKAVPEIGAAFGAMKLGNPLDFYKPVISA